MDVSLPGAGSHDELVDRPFRGVSEDGGEILIQVGDADPPHCELRVQRVFTIELQQTDEGADAALNITSLDGTQTSLLFRWPWLPELLEPAMGRSHRALPMQVQEAMGLSSMKDEEFVEQLQQRAHLGSRGEAVVAIRATLETLADRIPQRTAHHLAFQLPAELGESLRLGMVEPFGIDEFIERIAAREKVKPSAAAFHARVVISMVTEVVPQEIMFKVRRELPEEFETLFLPKLVTETEQRQTAQR